MIEENIPYKLKHEIVFLLNVLTQKKTKEKFWKFIDKQEKDTTYIKNLFNLTSFVKFLL